MPKKFSLAVSIVCLVLMIGCGNSPLLNHANATPTTSSEAAASTERFCAFKFERHQICGNLEWVIGPRNQQKSQFRVFFFHISGTPLSSLPRGLTIELWMKMQGMEHPSAPVDIKPINGTSHGVFVDNAYFTMHGGWEIRFEISQGHSAVERSLVRVNVP